MSINKTPIRPDQWRTMFSGGERAKIAAAYMLAFHRSTVRDALLNNQHHAPAVRVLQAFLEPLIKGDTRPQCWTVEQCQSVLAQPFKAIAPLEAMKLSGYWYVLTPDRKSNITSRIVAMLAKLDIAKEVQDMATAEGFTL